MSGAGNSYLDQLVQELNPRDNGRWRQIRHCYKTSCHYQVFPSSISFRCVTLCFFLTFFCYFSYFLPLYPTGDWQTGPGKGNELFLNELINEIDLCSLFQEITEVYNDILSFSLDIYSIATARFRVWDVPKKGSLDLIILKNLIELSLFDLKWIVL